MKKRSKRILVAAGSAVLAIIAFLLLVPAWTNAPKKQTPRINTVGTAPEPQPSFSVMSLNLAHGRNTGAHQALQSRERIEGNLALVSQLLATHNPDLVGLQEADAPSIWSGRFDHVAAISKRTGHHAWVQSEHVQGLGLHYGTGVLSRLPITEATAYTFSPSWPTFSKGFTHSRVKLGNRELSFVSVHLDFAKGKVRQKQADEMIAFLKNQPPTMVVVGDFNCQWLDKEDTVRRTAKELGLHTWTPEAKGIATFRSLRKRIDYILISSDLQFIDCRVLEETVSDHQPVQAKIRFK